MNNEKILKHNSQIVLLPINELIPYAKNNKDHSEEQINQLAGMIAAWEKVDPIRLDKNKVIISGHARVLALKKLGYTHAPCIIDEDLDEYQAMAFRIAHNKIADQATYNLDNIRFDLGTLSRLDFDLELTGLTSVEINELLNTDEVTIEDFNLKNEKEKKHIIEVTLPNQDELDSLYNELLSRGYIVKVK